MSELKTFFAKLELNWKKEEKFYLSSRANLLWFNSFLVLFVNLYD